MRVSLDRFDSTALVLGLFLTLAPATVSAQDADVQEAAAEPEIMQCAATVTPAELHAGQAAVQITATLSEDLGAIAGFEGPEESGLALADPADIPRAELAAEEEVQPIDITSETNIVSLWLTTAETAPGEYEAQLTSEQGSCAVTLTVTEGM